MNDIAALWIIFGIVFLFVFLVSYGSGFEHGYRKGAHEARRQIETEAAMEDAGRWRKHMDDLRVIQMERELSLLDEHAVAEALVAQARDDLSHRKPPPSRPRIIGADQGATIDSGPGESPWV